MPKKVLIGLDNFYYSILNSDLTSGVSYQTPVKLEGAISLSYNPNSEIATLFADDGPYDTAESLGELELEATVADISQENYAAIMGHTITSGVMEESKTDQPVNVAFGFRALRSNTAYTYVWLLKGKFAKVAYDHETKGDAINWQTPALNGKFTARDYDGLFKYSTRTDADDYSTATGSAWFDSVYGVTADTTNPTVSSTDPSANATSSSQTANVSIVFSEPMLTSTLTAENISIILPTAATTITATISVSSATVTLDHDSSLTASTTYNGIITTGVKDEAGNNLTSTYTWQWTTSA
jgi:phi13 family phage major tail protein